MHTKGGDSQWRGVILCRNWLPLHSAIIPECAFHTLLALEAALRGHQAFHYLVVGQITALRIEHFLRLGLNAVKDSDGMVGLSVIISPHHRCIVGIGTNDGNLLLAILQRKYVILILKQNYRLASHI